MSAQRKNRSSKFNLHINKVSIEKGIQNESKHCETPIVAKIQSLEYWDS
jgi:hypothetical protein